MFPVKYFANFEKAVGAHPRVTVHFILRQNETTIITELHILLFKIFRNVNIPITFKAKTNWTIIDYVTTLTLRAEMHITLKQKIIYPKCRNTSTMLES